MKNSKCLSKACTLSLIVLLLTGCSSGGGSSGPAATSRSEGPAEKMDHTVYTIKLAYTPAEGTPEEIAETAWAFKMKEYVESESNGRLVLEYYPGGQLGGHSETVTSVSNGSLEASIINLSVLNSFDGNLMALQIPGLYSDETEATAILNSETAHSLYQPVESQLGIRLSGIYCNGFRSFTTKGYELRSVDDISGRTMRVMDDQMYVAMVTALGANAVPMAANEMYVAMQNGVVDGHENTIANVLADLTYEVQDYMVLDKHTASICVGIVSQKFLDKLPDDLQTIVLEGMELGMEAGESVTARVNIEGIEKLRGLGMTIYEPTADELTGWQTAELNSTEAYVRKQIGDAPVDLVTDAISAYRGA